MAVVAATVGELAVELEARTHEFRRRLDTAERQVTRFEKQTGRSTARAGASFRGLVGPLLAIGGALAAIGATRAFVGLGRGAIESAGAFESYEVRLKGLLGSQEAANRSLESFVSLSSRTPFAVAQIVSGATTLASVAGGSREELESLTRTAANLAAVTGLSFEESAGNLQRSLSAGIGAADLFRERGVRKLIEDINGIPDLTKVPLEEQRELFKRTFGPGQLSPFGNAAEDLSRTLSGALSNIGDAADNASRSLGTALSPATFATARAVVIPFFESVRDLLDQNRDAITDFAVEGVAEAVRGFGRLLDTGADVLDFFDRWGIQLGDLSDAVGIIFKIFDLFFSSLRLGFQTVTTSVGFLAEGIGRVGAALGLIEPADVALLERFREESFAKLAADAETFRENSSESLLEIGDLLSGLVDEGESYSNVLRRGAQAAAAGADELERQAEAFRETRRQQAAALDEQAVLAARRRAEIDRLVADINSEFDAIDREFNEQVLTGQITLDTASLEDASDKLTATLGRTLSDVFSGAVAGEGSQSFAEGLADLSGSLLEDSLSQVLEDLSGSLSHLLSNVGQSLGELLPSSLRGGGLGGAIGGVLGVAGNLISRQLQGTSSRISTGLAESVVTSTQEVRGIVAGPTSIPIAEVGNAIRDAQGSQVAELRRSNALLEAILQVLRSGGAGGAESETLASAIADEFLGSPALG